MVVDDEDALVSELRGMVDGGLRVVAEYDAGGYDAVYVREDVTPRLDDVADEIHDDLILQGIGRRRLEDLFEAGSLHCSMHRFDDLTAFHFVAGEFAGLFVSVDTGVDMPLARFTAACKSRLP